MKKLERIQERAFRLLLNDYDSDYDQLLTKVNKPTLEIRRIKFLATEIFKTIHDLNPSYMKEIFELNVRRETGDTRLGQRIGMSETDIKEINARYDCSQGRNTLFNWLFLYCNLAKIKHQNTF